jgi:hypothetical protein
MGAAEGFTKYSLSGTKSCEQSCPCSFRMSLLPVMLRYGDSAELAYCKYVTVCIVGP